MKTTLIAALSLALAWILFAQQRQAPQAALSGGWEIHSAFPHEISPGRYEQVQPRELEMLAAQGWELVSVMPFIYRNEEHGGEQMNPKPVVTQSYPAYFFKRPKPVRGSF